MKGHLDVKQLESYKKADLQQLARDLGVSDEGTFKEIAARCAEVEVDIPDKEYGLLFSLNALDEVQGKFGGYDKLSEVFNDKNPNLFKDIRWLLTLLINEGLLAEDENAQMLDEKRVGRLIHAGNLQEVQSAIFKSFAQGTAGDEEAQKEDKEETETTEEGNSQAVQES